MKVTIFGNGDKAEKLGDLPTMVLLASDDQEAKGTIKEALAGSPLRVFDAGALKRARELEATGFLQMPLVASEQIAWTAASASLNKWQKRVGSQNSFKLPTLCKWEV